MQVINMQYDSIPTARWKSRFKSGMLSRPMDRHVVRRGKRSHVSKINDSVSTMESDKTTEGDLDIHGPCF